MHRATCPFASALFGSITGSAAGAASGTAAGLLLYASYAASVPIDAQGFALLAFGTLGTGVGGSGGAVGGMIEGWNLAGSGGSALEASGARWGAVLGGLWSLQPILWLAITAETSTALAYGPGIAAIVMALGAGAGLVGSLAARPVVRALGVGRASVLPIREDCR